LRTAAHESIASISCASDGIVVGSKPTESLNHQVISPVSARRGLFYPLPLEITGLAGSWGNEK